MHSWLRENDTFEMTNVFRIFTLLILYISKSPVEKIFFVLRLGYTLLENVPVG